jgi:putative SOS response-associated peptidase YedK/uncharacterized protein YndB with AHSA1/START domain
MNERLVIPDRADAEQELAVARPWRHFSVSFNVAVSHTVPVARIHDSESEGVMMRWGLVPHPGKLGLTHDSYARVRSDALMSSDNFRGAWFHGQRGIVPVAGFYVWQCTPTGFRQPYYVRLVNRLVFGVAVLWERPESELGDAVESCALVTVPSNSLLAEIDNTSDQMLAILRREDYGAWLRTTVGEAKELLDTYPRAGMVSHTVGPYVNNLDCDDPRLIQRTPEDPDRRDAPRHGAVELPAAADAIVEEITVKASAERVFVALTDPQQLQKWWSTDGRFEVTQAEVELRPGGKWRMQWSGVGGWPSSARGVFREIDRPRSLAFTWSPSGEEDPLESPAAQSSVVRFELQPQNGVTRVRVRHSEFTSARARARHHGWPEILNWLRVYAEEHA